MHNILQLHLAKKKKQYLHSLGVVETKFHHFYLNIWPMLQIIYKALYFSKKISNCHKFQIQSQFLLLRLVSELIAVVYIIYPHILYDIFSIMAKLSLVLLSAVVGVTVYNLKHNII